MVDLFGMFRRRPAKRSPPGFARTRPDITSLEDAMDMLENPVRDAPRTARDGVRDPAPPRPETRQETRQPEKPRPRARSGIGYLPQEASIFRGLTVEQNIRAVLEVVEPNKKKREAELNSLLDEFNITRLRKTPSIALSGGERRRVEIARALATRPNYMLLDEPFAGIDPIAVGDIQALVRHLTQRGIGVLITDHNVRETLGLTDRAYIIYSGEVLMEGEPDDIVNNPDVRRLYLGEEFRM